MEDRFNEYIEGLETNRWVGVTDLSEQFGVSERTVFQWLKDGKSISKEQKLPMGRKKKIGR